MPCLWEGSFITIVFDYLSAQSFCHDDVNYFEFCHFALVPGLEPRVKKQIPLMEGYGREKCLLLILFPGLYYLQDSTCIVGFGYSYYGNSMISLYIFLLCWKRLRGFQRLDLHCVVTKLISIYCSQMAYLDESGLLVWNNPELLLV